MNYFPVAVVALDFYRETRERKHFDACVFMLQRYHVYLYDKENRLDAIKFILDYPSSSLYILLAYYRHMPLYVKTKEITSPGEMLTFLNNYPAANPKTKALYCKHIRQTLVKEEQK